MKLLLACPHFPPRFIGGVELYVRRIADAIRDAGDQPEVLCVEEIDGQPDEPRVETDTRFGYPVHRLRLGLRGLRRGLGFYAGSPHVDALIKTLLERTAPDVLHVNSGYLLGGGILECAKALNVPTVLSLHDYWFICPRIVLTHPDGPVCSGPTSPAKCAWCLATEKRRFRLLGRAATGMLGPTLVSRIGEAVIPLVFQGDVQDVDARQRAQRRAFRCADAIISPSRFLRDQMAAAGMPAERIRVVRLGTVPGAQPGGPREPGPTRRFGFLGQVVPHKGVDVLVEAVRQLPSSNWTLSIHGDLSRTPAYVDRLRALADGDPRITFAGSFEPRELDTVLDELEVVVVPSTWYENAPLVILEAQSARKPVVASKLGGMQEMVADDENGLLAAPGDVTDLARQLERLMDPALVVRLSRAAPPVRTFADELLDLRAIYAEARAGVVLPATD